MSGSGKAQSRVMHADKPQSFLLKGGKKRPETAKPKKAEDLRTNEIQDEGMNLQKILRFYRDRVEAHEKDRFHYMQKMDNLRVKQDKAHQIEWEHKKRIQETEELSRALDQCQDRLAQERSVIEEMKYGGDRLKQKQRKNQGKIMNLLETTNSVE